jgi:hypothetical protein
MTSTVLIAALIVLGLLPRLTLVTAGDCAAMVWFLLAAGLCAFLVLLAKGHAP